MSDVVPTVGDLAAGWWAGGMDAVDFVVALVDAAPDAADLMLIGTGPLEDLVHEHGGELVAEIKRLAPWISP